jgi:hypothetical protein
MKAYWIAEPTAHNKILLQHNLLIVIISFKFSGLLNCAAELGCRLKKEQKVH